VTRRGKEYAGLGIAAGLVVAIALGMLLAVPLSAASSSAVGLSPTVRVHAPVSGTPTTAAKGVSCAAGVNPEFVSYDAANRYFYVDNVYGGSISIFKGACTLVTTIVLPSGAQPRGNAYDASNNYIYVADAVLNQLYVISGTKIIQTIVSSTYNGHPTLSEPWGVAYDPAGGYLFGSGFLVVANAAGDTLAFFASTPATSPTGFLYLLPVGSCPSDVAYVPIYNAVMVANSCSDNVTSIDATYLTVIDPGIPVGSGPQGIAFDPATDEVYVTNTLGTNVTVINAEGEQFGSITVGSEPIAAAFDQTNLHLYVTNQLSNTVSEISDLNTVSKTVTVSGEPVGLAWNAANGKMDVLGWTSGKVYVIA
jgi:YVTN family beta-propeller protein